MENINSKQSDQEFYDDLCFIRLRDDGILEINITADKEYDKNNILRIMANIKRVIRCNRHKMLIICSEDANLSYEALTIINTPFSSDYAITKAYVLKSISQRIMIGVFLRLVKSTFPTGLFKNLQDAEQWLNVQ